MKLQQYLPFTVLKLSCLCRFLVRGLHHVATVPTVYGIETGIKPSLHNPDYQLQQYLPFTVLKPKQIISNSFNRFVVATVPTVYGIETIQPLQ